MKKKLTFLSLLLILPLLVIFIYSGKAQGLATESKASSLPVVGSLEKLKSLLDQMEDQRETKFSIPSINASSQDASQEYGASGQGFSATNVQVKGVDEADIVKTDGEYIYQVNGRRVVIFKAHPPQAMKVQKVLQFGEKDFSPAELYVDDSFLVVIGSGADLVYPQTAPSDKNVKIYPPLNEEYVKAIVYDISDKNNINKIRELELEGEYVSSRKLGPALYLVANKNIDRYRIMEGEKPNLPGYRDSALGSKDLEMDLNKVRYFPDCSTPNYLLTAGINLNQPAKPASVSAYLGSGEEIYVSQSALYTAISRWAYPRPLLEENSSIVPVPSQANTSIYKFTLSAGTITFAAAGKVPGTILNQFSMDAYKGYLRVATTTGQIWRQDEGTSKNNVYVLDGALKITGKLENIAPGEKIYSARFMGDRAYMVTFKNVDPFFVIDVSSPKAPKVLGALKIPGYSDYLHPVDKNHVLGFGKDTVEEKQPGGNGQETSTAYYQGMKIALFDVSNVSRPVEKFKTVIGDRGTDSPLLNNHKALLFDLNKQLLAFPVTVMEVKGNNPGAAAYGEFSFQGAYVYSFGIDEGFQLRGRITHLDKEDMQKSGSGWYESEKNIDRVLYIDDTLYTVSKEMLKANDLNALAETGKLKIP